MCTRNEMQSPTPGNFQAAPKSMAPQETNAEYSVQHLQRGDRVAALAGHAAEDAEVHDAQLRQLRALLRRHVQRRGNGAPGARIRQRRPRLPVRQEAQQRRVPVGARRLQAPPQDACAQGMEQVGTCAWRLWREGWCL